MQILNILGLILPAITMFVFARNFLSNRAAILSGILYTLSNYHLYTIYLSGQRVEAFAWSYLPILLHNIYKAYKTSASKYFYFTALWIFLFIITHHSTFIIVIIPVLFFIMMLNISEKKDKFLIKIILAIIIGFLLSSFFLIPCLLEKKNVLFGIKPDNDYRNNFFELYQILFYFFWPKTNNPLFMPQSLNLAAVLFAVLAIFLFKKKKKNYLFISFVFFFIFGIFFNSKISKPIWAASLTIQYLETPIRFIVNASLACAILTGIAIDNISRRWLKNLLILIALILTYIQLKNHIKVYTINDEPFTYHKKYFTAFDTDNFNPEKIKRFEYYTSEDFLLLPVTFNYSKFNSTVENRIVKNSGSITNYYERPTKISFDFFGGNQEKILVNIAYFDGWTVYIDNKKTNIEITNDGLFTFIAPAGNHKIEIIFELTLLRKIAISISILTAVLSIIIILFNQRKYQ